MVENGKVWEIFCTNCCFGKTSVNTNEHICDISSITSDAHVLLCTLVMTEVNIWIFPLHHHSVNRLRIISQRQIPGRKL